MIILLRFLVVLKVLFLLVKVFMLIVLGRVIFSFLRVILFVVGFVVGEVLLEGVWINGLRRLIVSLRSF